MLTCFLLPQQDYSADEASSEPSVITNNNLKSPSDERQRESQVKFFDPNQDPAAKVGSGRTRQNNINAVFVYRMFSFGSVQKIPPFYRVKKSQVICDRNFQNYVR